MSAVKNPLAHLSDDQLVDEHSRSGANSHYVRRCYVVTWSRRLID